MDLFPGFVRKWGAAAPSVLKTLTDWLKANRVNLNFVKLVLKVNSILSLFVKKGSDVKEKSASKVKVTEPVSLRN